MSELFKSPQQFSADSSRQMPGAQDPLQEAQRKAAQAVLAGARRNSTILTTAARIGGMTYDVAPTTTHPSSGYSGSSPYRYAQPAPGIGNQPRVAQTGADPNALPFHGAANPSAGEFLVSKFAFGEMSRNDLSFTMGDIGDTPGPFKFVTDQSVDSKPDGSVTATSTVYGYDENTGAYSTFYATPQAPLRFWMDENDRLQVTPER